jgi:hypothetical protein
MKSNPSAATAANPTPVLRRPWVLFLIALVVTLVILFSQSFHRGIALRSNDSPLGVMMTPTFQMPQAFTGIWSDLNWLGSNGGTLSPNISTLLLWILGPHGYTNFYTPISVLLAGLAGAFFFRQLGLRSAAWVLGGIAAALNGNYFSNACWGLASRSLLLAAAFMAMAALVSNPPRHRWIKAALAGLCIGMGVMEGIDNGAIFSLFISAFVVFQAWNSDEAGTGKYARSAAVVAVMAIFAAFMAVQTVQNILGTQFKAVTSMNEGQQRSPKEQYDWATQWSLPKAESLRVVVPGLFGYLLDEPNGGNYWGRVGQQPGWDEHHQGFSRHSGSGEYAGILVVLLAAWAVMQALRREQSAFGLRNRRIILFWAVAALIALLLSWGRHAPFYKLLYALPYFNTVRNPMKFMHIFHFALLILFAFGVHGVIVTYCERVRVSVGGVRATIQKWWAAAPVFERKFATGMGVVLGASLLGLLIYAGSEKSLIAHLITQQLDENQAKEIAKFSRREVLWSIGFLAASGAVVLGIMAGVFGGARARWAVILLTVVLLTDLARASAPWIRYFNYAERYATNPVIDRLREKAWNQRVSALPFQFQGPTGQAMGFLQQIYNVEWAQHEFPYYKIHTLEFVQLPRMPEDYRNWMSAASKSPLRMWELTGTRFFFGLRGMADGFLNQQFDPAKKRFREVMAFNAVPVGKEVINVTTEGPPEKLPFALLEFTGALNRATLYTSWENATNDAAALERFSQPAFDPAVSVVVSDYTNAPAPMAAPGKVEIESYAPKRIRCKTSATSPSVLLLTDRYDPQWRVYIDGQPGKLLRCNYAMRGAEVPAGEHTVEFRFEPPAGGNYISLAASILGLLMAGYLGITRRAPGPEADSDEPEK